MSDEPDIVCEGLVRIYTAQGVEVQALQGLDLVVQPGEMVALIGASGSGKSTLLNILSGSDTPSAGRARVAGHDLVAMRGRERLDYRRATVGFVWQQSGRNLLPYLSGRENVAMAQDVAGVIPRRERTERVDALLEQLGVAHVADQRPAQLSGGQKQRVAIAVALANGPRVLLADEPTGELDEATSAEVLAAIEQVNREHGATTLIVTHDVAVAEHVDRTVRIRDGRTSTETLRATHTDESGRTVRVAAEYAVLDRAGRMQLPAEYVSALELRDRVRLSLEPDRIEVRPGGGAPAGAPPASRAQRVETPDAPGDKDAQRAQRAETSHPEQDPRPPASTPDEEDPS